MDEPFRGQSLVGMPPARRHPPRRPSTRGLSTQASQPLARILSVGDELVLGRVTDTNATFLCRLLTDLGLRVVGVQQVGDGQADLVAAMRSALMDADVLVISGGLGPTDDDRTRHALAETLGVELREHAPSWAAIVRHFAQLYPGREIAPVNRRQALLPRGAKPLANDRGTAPGICAQHGRSLIAVLPGVPHEMRAMAERLPSLVAARFAALPVPTVREVWFAGIGESTAQQRLGDLLSAQDPQVGITVSELGHLTLRVVGRPRLVAQRVQALRACVSEFLLPEPGLAPSLVKRLTARRQTITAAESCTGGHVAAMLTAVAGSSAVFRESIVTYHGDAKQARLGVPAALVGDQVVSEACVRAMAEGAWLRTGATLALATTGIAGPGGGTAANPVGTVWVGVATKAGTWARRVQLQGTRERIQLRAATACLQLAWEVMTKPDSIKHSLVVVNAAG